MTFLNAIARGRRMAAIFACLFCAVSSLSFAQSEPSQPATPVIVHSKFGGQIFGFDIDQNGTEGVLAEAQDLSNGKVEAAVETFDQKTGNILSVLVRIETQDDFVTLGVVGKSVGLIEHEHVVSLLNVQRTFLTINPLTANKFTGKWTPPVDKQHLIKEVSRTQGSANNAVFVQDNSGSFIPLVFSSNVAANTFGPVISITDSFNFGSVVPPMAYNTQTNVAVLGGGDGCFGCARSSASPISAKERSRNSLPLDSASLTALQSIPPTTLPAPRQKTMPAWNSTISTPRPVSPWSCPIAASSSFSAAPTSSSIPSTSYFWWPSPTQVRRPREARFMFTTSTASCRKRSTDSASQTHLM